MEDLSKVLTELAEQKLNDYKEKELKQLIEACIIQKTERDCYEVYRVCLRGLTSACLAFVNGLEFTGSTINTDYLTTKICDLLSDFSATFFDYMERFRV